jgi:hypothetical protein
MSVIIQIDPAELLVDLVVKRDDPPRVVTLLGHPAPRYCAGPEPSVTVVVCGAP